MRRKQPTWLQAFVILSLAGLGVPLWAPVAAWSRSIGNGSPETLAATSCDTGLCHGPMSSDVSVSIEGPTTLMAGETQNYTVSISGAISTQKGAGLNVALLGGGSLGLVDDNTQFFMMTGEITHIPGANVFPPPGGSVGDFSYNFSVNAPDQAGATLTLNAAMNAFNFNFINDDHDCAVNDDCDKWNTTSLPISIVGDPDTDGDGVADDEDNCIDVPNSDQSDTNGDGCGNACDADFDNNGVVGLSDFGLLSGNFGMLVPPANPDVDTDGNGAIGLSDFGLLSAQFGGPPGPSALSPDCVM